MGTSFITTSLPCVPTYTNNNEYILYYRVDVQCNGKKKLMKEKSLKFALPKTGVNPTPLSRAFETLPIAITSKTVDTRIIISDQ